MFQIYIIIIILSLNIIISFIKFKKFIVSVGLFSIFLNHTVSSISAFFYSVLMWILNGPQVVSFPTALCLFKYLCTYVPMYKKTTELCLFRGVASSPLTGIKLYSFDFKIATIDGATVIFLCSGKNPLLHFTMILYNRKWK